MAWLLAVWEGGEGLEKCLRLIPRHPSLPRWSGEMFDHPLCARPSLASHYIALALSLSLSPSLGSD